MRVHHLPGRQTTMAEYQRFSYDYFSGCNVNLFFGDTYVDEIVALEVNLEEKILPIYGYASHTYDAIVHGTRVVSGRFKINFVETGYLLGIMNKIWKNKNASKTPLKERYKTDQKQMTSKQFIQASKNATWKEIDDFATAYEDRFWQGGKSSQPLSPRKHSQYFNKGRQNNDITFDIVIHYGPGAMTPALSNSVKTTTEIINDVHIFGASKIIDPSGEPIQEEYQFLARDWNAS